MNNMEKQPTLVELIFQQISGKKARVYTGSLNSEGSWEGHVTLEYNSHKGLTLSSILEYNEEFNFSSLNETINNLKEETGISYNQRDLIKDKIMDFLKSSNVKVGIIHPWSIIQVRVDTHSHDHKPNPGGIQQVELTHKEGSKTIIRITK